jgi:hypothetical protein
MGGESVIDTNGHYIIPPSRVWNRMAGFALFNAWDTASWTQGIIDSNNKEVIPLLYDKGPEGMFIYAGGNTYFAGRRKGKMGVIDLSHEVLVDFEYDELIVSDTQQLSFVYRKDHESGVVRPGGEKVIAGKERIHYQADMYIALKKKKYALYDRDGKLIIPHKYDGITVSQDSVMLWKNRRYLLADRNGKILSGPKDWPGFGDLPFDSRCGGSTPRYAEPESYLYIPNKGAKLISFISGKKEYTSIGAPYLISPEPSEAMLFKVRHGSFYDDYFPKGEAFVDTNLRFRSPVFDTLRMYNMVGRFIQANRQLYAMYDSNGRRVSEPYPRSVVNSPDLKNADVRSASIEHTASATGYTEKSWGYSALFDTNGLRVSPYFTKRIVGVITDVKGNSLYMLSSRWMSEADVVSARNGKAVVTQAEEIVTADESPAKQFQRFKSFRYIPLADRKLVGKSSILFATDSMGREGIIDDKGNTIFPEVSFLYKTMEIISDQVKKLLKEERLPSLRGQFLVMNDSGRIGYLSLKGDSLIPGINFQYAKEITQIGEDVFYVEDVKERRLFNSKNQDLFAGVTINSAQRLYEYPRLLAVSCYRGNWKTGTFYFFMTEDGKGFLEQPNGR